MVVSTLNQPQTCPTFGVHLIVLKDPDGNFHQLIVSDDVNSSESLDKLLADKGMSEFEFQSANIDHEKKYIIEGLSIVKGKIIDWNDLPVGHHGKKKFLISVEYTDKDFRAIAKIAFHYFLQYFEHYTGNETEFEGIKDFIVQGGNLNEWVTEVPGSFIEDFKNGSPSTNIYGHFVVAEDTGDRIFVKLGFFCEPRGLQHKHFEVQIGKAPGLVKTPKTTAHQILYFEKKDDKGYIGEMKELRQYSKEFLSSLRVPKKKYLGNILKVII